MTASLREPIPMASELHLYPAAELEFVDPIRDAIDVLADEIHFRNPGVSLSDVGMAAFVVAAKAIAEWHKQTSEMEPEAYFDLDSKKVVEL